MSAAAAINLILSAPALIDSRRENENNCFMRGTHKTPFLLVSDQTKSQHARLTCQTEKGIKLVQRY